MESSDSSRVRESNVSQLLIRHRVRRPPWNDYQQIHTDPFSSLYQLPRIYLVCLIRCLLRSLLFGIFFYSIRFSLRASGGNPLTLDPPGRKSPRDLTQSPST